MSIVRHGDLHIPTCDWCGRELEPEYTFEDAITAMRTAGWATQRVDGCYENTCRDCLIYMAQGSDFDK